MLCLPARDDVPREQISSKCHRLLFLFPLYPTRRENRPNSRLFLFPLTLVSAWYLYHPCMVTTPWAFPAFQGAHNRPPPSPPPLPGREPFSPANRLLHSTRPDNHSQLGAIHSPRHCSLSPHIHSKYAHESAQEHSGISTRAHRGASTRTLWTVRRANNAAARGLQPSRNKRSAAFVSSARVEFWLLFLLPRLHKHPSHLHFCGLNLQHSPRPRHVCNLKMKPVHQY